MTDAKIVNAMTVDVEDYFHVSAFDGVIKPEDWSSCKPTVDYNTKRLIDLFAQYDTKATFFILGWVARAFPDLIKSIADAGHEVASHGTNHRRASTQTREQLKDDITTSLDLLEQASGKKVLGYRAPSFSINKSNEWAFELLAELGLKYSSSTYPIEHDLYGTPDWPRFKYWRDEGLWEIPIPTIRKNDRNVGIGGGGYFRLYPYFLSKKRIDTFLAQEKQPYSFYFHPWEIDANQPRVKGASLKSKLRHYINLSRMEGKIENLLKDYSWSTMENVYLNNKP
ncbi:XrtA system polysaccharide deacetylase [Thalassotalea marina]|uniref:Polysaccharide deacetylase n=1 Tax=Thalassotalea marina TaxID=1673741 RepID=A0A919EM84_9GAMM|nr:XrtA system polysaccharide deacetylase [Thalassotalea marina]GHF99387.1 polysaccharide deacetylase [Thalassotalea marina]